MGAQFFQMERETGRQDGRGDLFRGFLEQMFDKPAAVWYNTCNWYADAPAHSRESMWRADKFWEEEAA